MYSLLFIHYYALPDLHAFPTRRSSDLECDRPVGLVDGKGLDGGDFELELVLGLTRNGRECKSKGDKGVAQFHAFLYGRGDARSEEHTSELQSLTNLVCRLLLEKKKIYI